MALKQLYENNAATYLKRSLGGTTADVVLEIIDADADKFPDPIVGEEYFLVTIENVQTKVWEIVKVTKREGNLFTIQRKQECDNIYAFDLGAKVQVRVTRVTLENLWDHSADISGFVHIQTTPLVSWTVHHNLDRIPNTTIEIGTWDADVFTKEAAAEADITYIDSNSFTILFSEATSGRVICT